MFEKSSQFGRTACSSPVFKWVAKDHGVRSRHYWKWPKADESQSISRRNFWEILWHSSDSSWQALNSTSIFGIAGNSEPELYTSRWFSDFCYEAIICPLLPSTGHECVNCISSSSQHWQSVFLSCLLSKAFRNCLKLLKWVWAHGSLSTALWFLMLTSNTANMLKCCFTLCGTEGTSLKLMWPTVAAIG